MRPTAPFQITDFNKQTPTQYKSAIDANAAVLTRLGGTFAPKAQGTPNMTVLVDPGFIWDPNRQTLTQIGNWVLGDTTSGSPTISNILNTAGLANGQVVTGLGIPNNTTILSFTATSITLSANATATATSVALACSQVTATIVAPVSNSRIDRIVVDSVTGVVSVVAGTAGASPSAPAIPVGKTPIAQVLISSATTALTNTLITDERALGGASIGVVPASSTLSSAATTDLGTATTNLVNVTGSATVTSFGSSAKAQSPLYFLYFAAGITLTYNASAIKIPGNDDILTQVNDFAIALYLGAGVWQILSYFPGNGRDLGDLGYPSLASASTVDLGSKRSKNILITGSATITSFGSTSPVGDTKGVVFNGPLLLTYDATNLILPSLANITTEAGDTAEAFCYAAGKWLLRNYQRASGRALVSSDGVVRNYISGLTLTGFTNTTITVAAGQAADSANLAMIAYVGGTLNAATTGANGLRTGLSLSANASYGLFLLSGVSGQCLFGDNAITPGTLPTGYTTSWRRIATFYTDASSHIIPMIQVDRDFYWLDQSQPTLAINNTISTSVVTFTMPLLIGKKWPIVLRLLLAPSGTQQRVLFWDADGVNQVPGNTNNPPVDLFNAASVSAGSVNQMRITTNTSSQIKGVSNNSGSSITGALFSWTDNGLQ
jgi:hypothetical protein